MLSGTPFFSIYYWEITMQTETTTIEFDPVTGEFYKHRHLKVSIDPAPLATLFTPESYMLLPMLTPGDYLVRTPADEVILVHRFESIPFRTDMAVEGDREGNPVIRPTYSRQDYSLRSDEVQMVFTAQEHQEIWLVLNLHSGYSFILAQDNRNGCLHHPALPNTYANGALCTGAAALPDPGLVYQTGLAAYLTRWLEAWSECEFNADLNQETTNMFCKFDPETGLNVRIPDWNRYLPRLNPGSEIATALALVWNARKGMGVI